VNRVAGILARWAGNLPVEAAPKANRSNGGQNNSYAPIGYGMSPLLVTAPLLAMSHILFWLTKLKFAKLEIVRKGSINYVAAK
jgi:hypothetical protein